MNLKTAITKLHYSTVPCGIIYNFLKFLSFFYFIVIGVKNFLYDKNIIKPQKVNAFVISVGNFTTGGVGKTPVVAEIAKYYVSKKERVAIISRGYGGKLNNKNVNVISDGINLYYNADMAGDEPYWLAVHLNMCAVLTCANKYKACKYAISKLGVTKIILDDGFQHRKLYRNLDIVLVDSEKKFGNGSLLPAGPLRESRSGYKRVDKLVIVSKSINHEKAENYINTLKDLNIDEDNIILCKTEPDYVYNIISGEHLPAGEKITAMSAIGQPEQFYQFLQNYNVINTISFDDHHQYILNDIENISGNIVTTEKDAVKLARFNKANIYALKLKTVIDVEKLLAI